ncbi:MAG: CRTAC1 family protein [Gemmataceae bacterium]
MTTASVRWWGLVLLILVVLGGATAVYLGRPPARVQTDAPEETEPAAGGPLFEEVAGRAGVEFTYRNGEEADRYTILESVGGGIALLDYDGDGLLDLYIPGGGGFAGTETPRVVGLRGRLYRNLGGWKFQDVTEAVLPAGEPFYSHGAAVGDFDGDGWPDLLVTGYGRMVLYRNEGGRRLVDVTAAVGLREEQWTTSAAWVDLTGKGRPDLYVCRYLDWSFANDPRCGSKGDPKVRDVCEPARFKALPHALFRFQGGKYVDVSQEMGLRRDGMGLGVVAADVDDDGKPDVYVANDAGHNFLYRNRGKGPLEEVGLLAGVAGDDLGRYNGSMGVDAGDYDGSGRASLWVTNYQGEYHALYRNLGKGQFDYQTRASGLAALGQQNVGFGTGFIDLENDGWLDLILVNGHVLRHPVSAQFRQRAVLLRNEARSGRRFFANISRQGGPYFEEATLGRGLAIGDLDNDGWPDVVVSHCNRPVAMLRNTAPRSARWLGIQLRGKQHRCTVGARVTVEVGGRTLTRFRTGGGSYLSASDSRLLFGLGSETTLGPVHVHWPWGQTERFEGLKAGQYWELIEGIEKAQPMGAIRP